MKNNYMIKKVINILLYLVLTVCIGTVLIATLYGLPSADDFTNTIAYQTFPGSKLEYMWWKVVNAYKGWQGTYFGVFLCSLHTYYEFGLAGLRIQMMLSAIFFFYSIIICIQTGIDKMGLEKDASKQIKLLTITMAIFYFLNTNQLSEIFYWQTGLCVYTIPLSLSFLTIFSYLKYEITGKKKKWLVIGSIFALCGAGGALDVSAFLCAILLLGILYNFVIKKKIEANCIIGISAFIGAVINVFAPGNYVRHEYFDSEIRYVKMMFGTIERVNDILSTDFQSGILLAIIIVIFVSAYGKLAACEFEFKYPGLVTIYCYIGILLTVFPVLLGFSVTDGIPVRCCFVERVSIIIFILIATIYWSGWASQKKILNLSREIIFILTLIYIIPTSSYFQKDALKEFTIYRMCEHLIKGDYADKAKEEESIVSQIENSNEQDVVVTVSWPREGAWTNLKTIGLMDNAEHWVNVDIADYYGKNSIILQYVESSDE